MCHFTFLFLIVSLGPIPVCLLFFVAIIAIKEGAVCENAGGCRRRRPALRVYLPARWPVSSRSAAAWSARSRPCCPSAGSPPGGATARSSAERAPSCSVPETMAMVQRHHLLRVSMGDFQAWRGWGGTQAIKLNMRTNR